jgi:hypothetical protein
MAWSKTYTHSLAIAVDILAATLFVKPKDFDITISSYCAVELRKQAAGLKDLNPKLLWLGGVLNKIQENHCEMALVGDLERMAAAQAYLQSVPAISKTA